jgi:hypothetical protein
MNMGCASLALAATIFGSLCAATRPLSAQTWTEIAAPSTNIGPIACSADGSKLLLASGDSYQVGGILYVSHDAGQTWTAADAPAGVWVGLASSADGTTLVASQAPEWAIYTSSNAGATWDRSAVPVVWWQDVACSADGTKLFAAGALTTNNEPGAIWFSNDSGRDWKPTGAPPAHWVHLACSADGATLVAGEGDNVWVSTNSGGNFHLAYEQAAPPYIVASDEANVASLACSASGGIVAVGVAAGLNYTNVGVATSADGCVTWTWAPSGAIGAVSGWGWFPVVCSADGRIMAALMDGMQDLLYPVWGAVLWASRDQGASWAEAPWVPWDAPPPSDMTDIAPWTGLAMSADGRRLTGTYVVDPWPNLRCLAVTLQQPPEPNLALARSGGGLTLSWMVPSMGFVVQESPALGTNNWTEVAATPVVNYSTLRYEVTIPTPSGTTFYRLISGP